MFLTKIVTGPEEREFNGPLKPPLWNGTQPGTRAGQIYYDNTGALDGTPGPIYWDGTLWKKYSSGSFVSSSASGLLAAQRVGDTLIGIRDQYTGEYLSFNKVTLYADGSAMTDAKVDTIMYVKVGSEYFLRQTSGVINVKWWNAKGDAATDDSVNIRSCFSVVKGMLGGTIYFPPGTYIITRRVGTPNDMILISSNMKVYGAGMGKTTLKLNPSDLLNFRRMFQCDDTANVTNIEISDLAIDMSNTFTTYPPGGAFPDAQNAGVFLFSTANTISNVYLHDLFIHDVTGDTIGVSKNATNVVIERIYQRDYLRQGISIGGSGGVNNIYISKIYDLPFINGVIKGGNSIHCEPASPVDNLYYSDSVVQDFSASNVLSGGITNVRSLTTVAGSNVCNNVQNFSISKCTLAGRLQVSPAGDNVSVSGNFLNDGLVITSVGGVGLRNVNNVSANFNEIVSNTYEGIKVDNVDGVNTIGNDIRHSNNTGIYYANALSGTSEGNKIRTTGNFYSIYFAITLAPSFGAGYFTAFSNIIYNTYRGISANNVSVVIGPNFVNGTLLKVHIQGTYTKFFAHSDGYSQILSHSVMPTWGEYSIGDEIKIPAGSTGVPLRYVCTRAGALHEGVWSGAGAYVINSYVKGSDNKVYRATVVGGQAIDPVTDTTNTFWVQASALEGLFSPVGTVSYTGTGSPEGVVTAAVGSEYINTAGTAGLIKWGKQSGSGNTGWAPIW